MAVFNIALRDNGTGTFDISLASTGKIKVWTAGAQYWRLRMTATNTDDSGDTFYLEIASAELRTSVGGTNVALSTNTPAVTATGTNTAIGAPSNAIDGNNSTYWQAEANIAAPGGTSDLDIDLKFNYNITEVAIRNGTISAVRAPTTVAIYTSPDNSTWTLLETWTPASWTTTGQEQTFTLNSYPYSWVAKRMKVWTGAAWVTNPVKFWNGSAWVTTTY